MKRLLTSLGAALALALCAAPVLHASVGRNHPPIPKVQVPPVYPLPMRAAGMQGEVLVRFVVDANGNVSDVSVDRTTNPAFNDAALTAVLQWKFLPGEKAGRPVSTRLTVPIQFSLDEPEVAASPGVLGTPVYPTVDLATAKSGWASVQVDVTRDGKVSGVHLLSASAPEFGNALMAAAQAPSYIPARHKGVHAKASLVLTRQFCIVPTPNPDQVCPSGPDQDFALRAAEEPGSFCGEKDLDEPLGREAYVSPVVPLPLRHRNGSATISFYVDEGGVPRLPAIVSATDPEFGYAVIHAVAYWRYHTPMRDGRPAAVATRVTFTFSKGGKIERLD